MPRASTWITMLLLSLPLPLLAQPEDDAAPELEIRRLSWAGVQLQYGDVTLLVDPVITDIWNGENDPVIAPEITTRRRYVLITHLHNDHYDRAGIGELLGERGRVICPPTKASYIASDGFKVRPANLYEPLDLGGVTVTAVPASDGFGEEQVSWVIATPVRKVIHCGDTIWHGAWWRIGKQFGPFDVAFLPINGVNALWMKPESEVPATLTPEQAVAAAVVLGAEAVVPIHYGVHDPGIYEEYPHAEDTLREKAKSRGVAARILAPGENLNWDPESQ